MPSLTTIAVAVAVLYLIFGIVTKATKWIFRIALAVIVISMLMHGYDAVENKFFSDGNAHDINAVSEKMIADVSANESLNTDALASPSEQDSESLSSSSEMFKNVSKTKNK